MTTWKRAVAPSPRRESLSAQIPRSLDSKASSTFSWTSCEWAKVCCNQPRIPLRWAWSCPWGWSWRCAPPPWSASRSCAWYASSSCVPMVPSPLLADERVERRFEPRPFLVGQAVAGRAAHARFQMVFQDEPGDAIEGGAHRRELDQHVGAGTSLLDHALDGRDVPARPGELVGHDLRLTMRVARGFVAC